MRCELDTCDYPEGDGAVSDEEMGTLNIEGDAFHPEWNYNLTQTTDMTPLFLGVA